MLSILSILAVRNGPSKLSTVKKKNSRIGLSSDLEIFTTASAKNLAPEPCKTCGRPDQPERFHSHPKGSQTKIKDIPTTTTSIMKKSKTTVPPVPKSIQKPVALNFRSDRNKNKIEDAEASSKDVAPRDPQDSTRARLSSALNKRGPKSITCYICGREFGTASFPIHEPKCIEVSDLIYFFTIIDREIYNYSIIDCRMCVIFEIFIYLKKPIIYICITNIIYRDIYVTNGIKMKPIVCHDI